MSDAHTRNSVNCKNRTYAGFHHEQNMQFVPLVGTTLGRLGADALAMSWGLTHRPPRRLSWPKVWTLCPPPRVSTPGSSSSFALASSTATLPAFPSLCAGLAVLVASRRPRRSP
eukprot:2121755-Rhodomonas_salina.1